jgi:hypothetical protein
LRGGALIQVKLPSLEAIPPLPTRRWTMTTSVDTRRAACDGSFRCGGHGMARKRSIASYSADELAAMPSETNWAKVDATASDEVERQADADSGPLPEGWEDTVALGAPDAKGGVATAQRSAIPSAVRRLT